MSPIISVIVPVYNVQPYLRQCMESLMGQTLHDIEIICVDDGSTDGSGKILAEYASIDERVRVVTCENGGQSAARNTGLDMARAPFIMFCDSDDWYEATMCEQLFAAISKSGSDISICGTEIYYECDARLEETDNLYYKIKFKGKQIIDECIILHTDVSAWNKIYRKSIIEQFSIRFPEGLKYEDAYFFNAYMACSHSAFFLQEKLYHYRRRPGSIMNIAFMKKGGSIDHLRVAILLYDFYKRNHLLSTHYVIWCILFSWWGDFALKYACSQGEKEEIYELSSSFAREHIKNFTTLPWEVTTNLRRLIFQSCSIKTSLPVSDDLIPRKLLRFFSVEKSLFTEKIKLLGFSIYKVKYVPNKTKYYFLGIPLYRKNRYSKIKLSTKKFHSLHFDNNVLVHCLRSLGPFTYIPNPGNMGDMLIAAATFQFFKRYKLPFSRFDESEAPETIVYGGGGIWTKDYAAAWARFLPLFQRAKRIVILPSSFYDCEPFIRQMDGRFTVFCREHQSYDYLLKAGTGAKVILEHDMALRLQSSVLTRYNKHHLLYRQIISNINQEYQNRSRIGYFLRSDCERVCNLPSDLDLSSFCGGDEHLDEDFSCCCSAIMLSVVDSVDAVVTDRLHVCIAGLLMGKEVYLLDNSYHKCSGVFNYSLSRFKSVHFVDKIPQYINPPRTAGRNMDILFNAILKLPLS